MLEIDDKLAEIYHYFSQLFWNWQKGIFGWEMLRIWLMRASYFSNLYNVCDTAVITSILSSLHISVMLLSRTREKGSGSSSNVKHVVPHFLNRIGNFSAGCPRITNKREFKRRRLWSKSSRHCRRNLRYKNHVNFLRQRLCLIVN